MPVSRYHQDMQVEQSPKSRKTAVENRKYLTPGDLGQYHHRSCQLALWKFFHEGHQPRKGQQAPSSITRGFFKKGIKWEASLVQRLEEQNLILRFSSKTPLVSQIIVDPRFHFYIINSAFEGKGLFKHEYEVRGLSPVEFGQWKPDFIEIWKRIEDGKLTVEWHVIDAKSSKEMQVKYTMSQIADLRFHIKHKYISIGVRYRRFFRRMFSSLTLLPRFGFLMKRPRRHFRLLQ